MPNSAVLAKAAMMVLMVLGAGGEAAPTERGFVDVKHTLPGLTRSPAGPGKPSALNPSQYLKRWLLNARAAADGPTTAGTITAAVRGGRSRTSPGPAGPDKRDQMLKMISALEELHRTFNSTLSSRITIVSRANGRNSGRKNKAPPALGEGGAKPTTAAPAPPDSTASRASADAVVPGLTGRNFKKSLPPQAKKTNKRVCFWKYCSQN